MTFGDRMLSVAEVAERLGFESVEPIRRAIRRGELRAYKIRGRLRIDPEDLRVWVEEQLVEPAATSARSPAAPSRQRAAGPSGNQIRRQASGERPSFRELAKGRRTA